MSVSKRKEDSERLCTQLLHYICANFKPDSLIAAFWPMAQEIDIKPLLVQLDSLGFQVTLPKIIEKDAPLRFFQWSQDAPMTVGHFNIPEPLTNVESHAMPDLILTPLLGFTPKGDRLGYGKGYYDRTLAQWITQGYQPFTIGLSWDEGLIEDESYQAASHDIPLQKILTPSAWIL